MKRRVSISILIGLLLTVADWTTTSNRKSSTLAVEPPNNTCLHVGRLISIQGGVKLKRKKWSGYHPTAVGTELCLGDWLQPAYQARVIVQCADPTQDLWTVPTGSASGAASGCTPPSKTTYTFTHPITPSRDPLAQGIPYIISPNNTWLLNDKPLLRWIAVPGATSYLVRVSGPWVNWQTEVSATSVVYPGKPPLKPVEEGYLITVEADNGESPAKATFGLLDERKAALVRTATKRLARQNLTEEAKSLAQVELYVGQGLIAEATELLEALVTKGSKTATVYHMLGDLYAQMQLFRQAKRNYLQAVALATTAKDIEGQAAAAARLWEVEKALGNSDTAAYWLKQAKKGYQTLFFLKPVTD